MASQSPTGLTRVDSRAEKGDYQNFGTVKFSNLPMLPEAKRSRAKTQRRKGPARSRLVRGE